MIALGFLAITSVAVLGCLITDHTNIGAGMAELVKGSTCDRDR